MALHQFCFFFNDTATTEIYTLSLHDALPIYLLDETEGTGVFADANPVERRVGKGHAPELVTLELEVIAEEQDRKSTRLNSSHANISYAVFCLKKKKTNT